MKKIIDQLKTLCQEARSILITGPIFPDGDSIGACLALKLAIESISKAEIDISGDITFRYQWMNGTDSFKPDRGLQDRYDLAIVVDGDRHRLPPAVEKAFNQAVKTVLIDHHSSTDSTCYSISLLKASSASTCEIVLAILDQWAIPLNKILAEYLYTGLIFDTGGFRHSNSSALVHQSASRLIETGIDHSKIYSTILVEKQHSGLQLLARCISKMKILADGQIAYSTISLQDMNEFNCTQGDIEGIIDMLVFTKGVELACILIERTNTQVKISLRSRRFVNVAQLASRINSDGGGHVRAAGAMTNKSLHDAEHRIPPLLCQSLHSH